METARPGRVSLKPMPPNSPLAGAWRRPALWLTAVVVAAVLVRISFGPDRVPTAPRAARDANPASDAPAVPAPTAGLPGRPPRLEAVVAEGLHGVVLGEDHRPVAGALVVATPSAEDSPLPPATGRTDASGAFLIPLKSGTACGVSASAEGYSRAELAGEVASGPLSSTPRLEIRLRKGWSLSGTVTEPAGKPIGAARLSVREGTGRYAAAGTPQGTFAVTGIAPSAEAGGEPGVDELRCSAEGYGPAVLRNLAPGSHVRIVLVPAAALEVDLTLAEREPTASFSWTLRLQRIDEAGQVVERLTEFAHGTRLRLGNLNPGLYRLSVSAAGRRTQALPDVVLPMGRTRSLQVVLEKAVGGTEAAQPSTLILDDTDLFREQADFLYAQLRTAEARRDFKAHFRKMLENPERAPTPAQRRAIDYVLTLPEE